MPMRPPVHIAPGYDRKKARRQASRAYDKKRLPSSQRGYNATWRKLRDRFVKEHPLCAECLKQGIITPGAEVDHIIPHRGDQELFFDMENLQHLCTPCHTAKTIKEGGSDWAKSV